MSNPILFAGGLHHFFSELFYFLLFARCGPPDAVEK